MLLNKILTLFVLIGLAACGGSSTESSTVPIVEPQTPNAPAPTVIENIICDVSYSLDINSVYHDNTQQNISSIFDGDKTNNSNWQATNLDTSIVLELTTPALLKSMVITWQALDYVHMFKVYASKDTENWQLLNSNEQSEKQALIPDLITFPTTEFVTAKYIKLELLGNEISEPSAIVEVEAFGCTQNVSHNIELIDWYLSVPTDNDNNGKSDSIQEDDLESGYSDNRFFALSSDGGLQFTTSVSGFRTSTNTKYVRSELREMLRRGDTSYKTQGVNKNNWVFSSAPQEDLDNAGGIDGELSAEVAINSVTTTGEDYQIGRVIIGQIHANDDEPARLYYRKLPNNTNGAIYLAHEILDGEDLYYEIIGSRSNTASNDDNGIPLDEKFNYTISVEGKNLTVRIIKANGSEYTQTIDMSDSGYDQGGQYMYFKAGAYNQNNSGDPHDYVQATFYKITNTHNK